MTRIQEKMTTQLCVIEEDKAKGKSATKTQEATDELSYLMTFNVFHRQWLDLSDFVFITMASVTPFRWDNYLDLLKHSVNLIKVDTMAALKNSPLHMTFLPR